MPNDSSFSSPIDAQIPQQPDPQLQTQDGLVYNEFNRIYLAIRRLQIGTTFGSVGSGVGATGASQSTASALTGDINVINSSIPGGGVVLPSVGAGSQSSVKNFSTNSVNIYPQSGGRINQLAINAPFVLVAGAGAIFYSYADSNYFTI